MSATSVKCGIKLDLFKDFKVRLQVMSIRLASLGRLSATYCRLCSSMSGTPKMHTGGCPKIFNHCFKCIGRHAGRTCSEGSFQLPAGVCWGCWMPLQSTFGVTFHKNHKDNIGSGCSSPVRGVLKELAIIFFHDRQVAPGIICPSKSRREYQNWLFETSSAGEGQFPNIMLLLEAALHQNKL